MKAPDTSTSLLKAVSADSRSARWAEFVERYKPMMVGYLKAKFPYVECEDVLQETFAALSQVLPNYRYDPDEAGPFRAYLAAVLRNKACDAVKRKQKQDDLLQKAVSDPTFGSPSDNEVGGLQTAVFKIALQQLLADADILERNRRIFVEVAINGRSPLEVAEMFGVTRNNVDQVKARLVKQLQDRVSDVSRLIDER